MILKIFEIGLVKITYKNNKTKNRTKDIKKT